MVSPNHSSPHTMNSPTPTPTFAPNELAHPEAPPAFYDKGLPGPAPLTQSPEGLPAPPVYGPPLPPPLIFS